MNEMSNLPVYSILCCSVVESLDRSSVGGAMWPDRFPPQKHRPRFSSEAPPSVCFCFPFSVIFCYWLVAVLNHAFRSPCQVRPFRRYGRAVACHQSHPGAHSQSRLCLRPEIKTRRRRGTSIPEFNWPFCIVPAIVVMC